MFLKALQPPTNWMVHSLRLLEGSWDGISSHFSDQLWVGHKMTNYCSMSRTGQSLDWGFRWIPNILEFPSRSVFPLTWLNSSSSLLGKRRISGTLTCPMSPGLSPLKNTALKYAWSLAKMKRWVGLIEGGFIDCSMWVQPIQFVNKERRRLFWLRSRL